MSLIRRNEMCPCGSQLKYKKCCGSFTASTSNELLQKSPQINCLNSNGFYKESLFADSNLEICRGLPSMGTYLNQTVPPGMMIVENFLESSFCDSLIRQTNLLHSQKATIVSSGHQGKQELVVENDRKTDVFGLGDYDQQVKARFIDFFESEFKKNYKDRIEWLEQPQLLRYQTGGFYHYHADSEAWKRNLGQWRRVMNRDYSFLLYLNDDFEGGEILFPNFEFELKPKKGLFVCFPSDHRFIHKVVPTRQGVRYVIVTWAAKENTQLVGQKPASSDVVYI